MFSISSCFIHPKHPPNRYPNMPCPFCCVAIGKCTWYVHVCLCRVWYVCWECGVYSLQADLSLHQNTCYPAQYDWDLAINWVSLHIDGVLNARQISKTAEVDMEMVLSCLRVLRHHGTYMGSMVRFDRYASGVDVGFCSGISDPSGIAIGVITLVDMFFFSNHYEC